MKMRRLMIAALLAAAMTMCCSAHVWASDAVKSVQLNDQGTGAREFISADEGFTSADGKQLRLTMTGLTSNNKAGMISALEQYFQAGTDGNAGSGTGSDSDTPIKIEDADFVDVEKWDANEEKQSDYFYGYDRGHCWAASCANMLWLSGWAKGLINPRTGKLFRNEDDIFEYYNVNFFDHGNDTDRAIDWFFMGEFFTSGPAPSTYTFDNHSGGLMKTFVSSVAQKQHDLVKNPESIGEILKVAAGKPEERAMFEVTVGEVLNDELTIGTHAITGIGLITDPNAENIAERYKAIILADSDNDAHPSAEELAERDAIMQKFEGLDPIADEDEVEKVREELIKYKESRKELRPRSYTVYKLRYSEDITGTPYWEVVQFSDRSITAMFNLDELMCCTDAVLRSSTETEGSADVNTHVDFTLDNLFTTSNETSVRDPYEVDADKAKKHEFRPGEPVNVNYFLANRSNVTLDDSYPGGNKVTVDWTVTRDSDGGIIDAGSVSQAFNTYKKIEEGAMLFLNKTDTGYSSWDPGEYTVKVSFNKDRKFNESYYLNNHDRTLHFTITAKAGPAEQKKANTLKVSSKTVKVSLKKLKKYGTVVRKNAITVSENQGPVTYQLKSTKYAKKISIDKKSGKITIKKGLKKGPYKVTAKVTAAGNDDYRSKTKTVTFRIIVK